MSPVRVFTLTSIAMFAFAGNSLLCRLALSHAHIDAASFTAIRLLSGALVLWVAVRVRGAAPSGRGNWISALALLAYAAGFSFAYVGLSAATGALLLFGAVQATMLGGGLLRGERLNGMQLVGVLLAIGGLVALLLPGLSAPPVGRASLMLGAGVAWGIYSLRGQGAGDSTKVTAGNFLRAAPVALALVLIVPRETPMDRSGMWFAVASGALASGVGYAIWYTVLPALRSTTASVVQLSVPVIATLSGSVLLAEAITSRLIVTSCAILGGIATVVLGRRRVI
jgi:drug/metabolite transporter (DMT)-like permease